MNGLYLPAREIFHAPMALYLLLQGSRLNGLIKGAIIETPLVEQICIRPTPA